MRPMDKHSKRDHRNQKIIQKELEELQKVSLS